MAAHPPLVRCCSGIAKDREDNSIDGRIKILSISTLAAVRYCEYLKVYGLLNCELNW